MNRRRFLSFGLVAFVPAMSVPSIAATRQQNFTADGLGTYCPAGPPGEPGLHGEWPASEIAKLFEKNVTIIHLHGETYNRKQVKELVDRINRDDPPTAA
jgi:hypothetical protein